MKDEDKTKKQLIGELQAFRRKISNLQRREAKRLRLKEVLLAGESKYRTLIENIPQKVFVKNRNSAYVSCNESYARDLKIRPEEIAGKTDYAFYPREMAEKYVSDDRRIMELGRPEDIEETYARGGQEIIVQTVKTPIKDRKGDVVGILGIFWDITERKRVDRELERYRNHLEDVVFQRTVELETANEQLQREIAKRIVSEEALRDSERKYSTLVENSLTGIYVDQDGKIQFANNRFADIYGYSREEIAGMRSWRLVHPEDRALTDEIRAKRLRGGEAPSEYEARGLTKEGQTIWVTRRNTRIEYRGRPAILGNIVDITERKRAEDALRRSEERLRFLSSQLLTAQERERRRISIELHDELGQALTVLKLRLRSVGKEMKMPPALQKEREGISQFVDEIIENVRQLSKDLYPSILKGLRLWPALRWLIEDFGDRSNIGVSVDMADVQISFSEEAQKVIYRIFQEALTNIARHALASQISVSVKKQGAEVRFCIADDGLGFDKEKVFAQDPAHRGLGMTTMEERVRMLGGSFHLWSKEGTGTRITFDIPASPGGGDAALSNHPRG